MKKSVITTTCLICLVILKSAAQTFPLAPPELTGPNAPFVVAGETNGLVPGDKMINLVAGVGTFGEEQIKFDSIDVNFDGIYDVRFNVSVCNTFDCEASSATVESMNPGFNFVNGPENIRRFVSGDTIALNANWDNWTPLYHNGVFVASGSGLGGVFAYGEWLNHSTGYFGFRFVTPASDTLLGWMRIVAVSAEENGAQLRVSNWAVQHDPAQKPFARVSVSPVKPTYCKGDSVTFSFQTAGADQVLWHFWDQTTSALAQVTRVLPDSNVTVVLEAVNQVGTTVKNRQLKVSPLQITAPDVVIDCAHPQGELSATTNIPADIFWIIGGDTISGPTPPVIVPPVWSVVVLARDAFGCVVQDEVDILMDTNTPSVAISYDEANHLLVAQSPTTGVTFMWSSDISPETFWGDSVIISQSGNYTVLVTAPNGCTSSASIQVTVVSTEETRAGILSAGPNPVGELLYLENRGTSDAALRLFDLYGRVAVEIGRLAAGGARSLPLAHLPPGAYMLEVSADNRLFYRKLLKK